MREDMTLDEAKVENLRWQEVIVNAYDDARVASVEKAQEGVLLSCSDDQHQWTGRLKIGLEGGLDERRDVGTLGDVFAEEDGFQVSTREDEGYLMVVVSGPDGSAFVGSTEPGEDAVRVATASRCFTLRDNESSFGTY